MSAIDQTIATLRALGPIPVYVTLHKHAAQGMIVGVEARRGHRDNKIGIDIEFGGQRYLHACTAGKAMRAALYEKFPAIPRTSIDTLDAWHKMKVVVNRQVLRLGELLPPAARTGRVAMVEVAAPAGRPHDLVDILATPGNIVGEGYAAPPLPPRRPAPAHPAVPRRSAAAGKRRKTKTTPKQVRNTLIKVHMTALMTLFQLDVTTSEEVMMDRVRDNIAEAARAIGRDDLVA